MAAMITPRIKPSAFWRRQPTTDLFVQDQRQAKLGNFIASLAAMDELIDFAAIATEVDRACPLSPTGILEPLGDRHVGATC
jgi:IS5 family transposase